MTKAFHPVLLLFVPTVLGFAVQWGLAIAPTIAPTLAPALTLTLAPESTLDQGCLTLALLLLCTDQARMAAVDLQNTKAVRSHLATTHPPATDPRLDRFTWVTLSTIVIELIGFYLALLWPGWGTAIVLMSQLWFHGLAGVQLQPEDPEPILTMGVGERSPVLIANTVGITLILLWQYNIWPQATAVTLLAMVLIYGLIKYWPSRPIGNSR